MRILIVILFTLTSSCISNDKAAVIDKAKKEILETERAFADLAAKEGIYKAFTYYAADDAVLLRKNQLVKGREAIGKLYQEDQYKSTSLNWTPDYVDVSSSGDLGFTYGKYTISFPDSLGKIIELNGVFHTVWKKQNDGKWRYVWD